MVLVVLVVPDTTNTTVNGATVNLYNSMDGDDGPHGVLSSQKEHQWPVTDENFRTQFPRQRLKNLQAFGRHFDLLVMIFRSRRSNEFPGIHAEIVKLHKNICPIFDV